MNNKIKKDINSMFILLISYAVLFHMNSHLHLQRCEDHSHHELPRAIELRQVSFSCLAPLNVPEKAYSIIIILRLSFLLFLLLFLSNSEKESKRR